jgi:hypothetical protein
LVEALTLPKPQQKEQTMAPPPVPPLPPPSMQQKPISLAQSLTNAKLRKVTPNADEASIAKDARSRSVGSVESSLTAAKSCFNSGVISEMAATLARRRLVVDSHESNNNHKLFH